MIPLASPYYILSLVPYFNILHTTSLFRCFISFAPIFPCSTIFSNPFHLPQLPSFFPTLSHILPCLFLSNFFIFLRFYSTPTSFPLVYFSTTQLLSTIFVLHSSSRSTSRPDVRIPSLLIFLLFHHFSLFSQFFP